VLTRAGPKRLEMKTVRSPGIECSTFGVRLTWA
jgi:hypothetical protein